jgi:hypothetical protein
MTRSKVKSNLSVPVNKRALDVLYAYATALLPGLDLNLNLVVLTVPLIPNSGAVVGEKLIAILNRPPKCRSSAMLC